MYEEFYKFSGKPFQLNPDPSFFFQSKGHQRAMAYLRYGIQQEQGFIIVTGDVGTGKTMLVNNLFNEIDDSAIVAAKIVSTSVRESDLLRLVASEFGLPYERSSKAALLRHLEAFFKSCKEDGKRVLIVVDEAQNLPQQSIEELRMLSNFDYNGEPVVQSFLLGQREFRRILRAPGLEQLRQRVLAAYHLKPLSDSEVKTYIEHRLQKVGWQDDPHIEDDVYFGVYRFTGGVPRRINTLFDRLLLSSCLEESHTITVKDLEAVADEIEQERKGDGDSEEDFGDAGVSGQQQYNDDAARQTMAVGQRSAPVPIELTAELQKLDAKLSVMQRSIESLSSQLQNNQHYQKLPDADSHGGLGRTTMWLLIFGLGIAVIGTAGLFVTKFLA